MTKLKKVPDNIQRPDYALNGTPKRTKGSLIKSPEQISRLRHSCKIAKKILNTVCNAVRVGVTTEELDEIAHQECIKHGGYPSPLNYRGFPKSLCTSINNVICHGIPSSKQVIKDGDIINCDVTIYLNGMHGDCSKTVCVGNVRPEVKELVELTEKAMLKGIEATGPGKCVSDIGLAIQKFVKESGKKYGIVSDFSGHGIGSVFHMNPMVCHAYNPFYKFPLKPGMAFTVEPMLNLGAPHAQILSDRWTAITVDGAVSAQFENTILITETGYEILTVD